MSAAGSEPFENILQHLRSRNDADPTFSDVVTLAEIAAESMQRFVASVDLAVYRELRDIAAYITRMKEEIGAFQANDLKDSRIPAAGHELDAVIRSTEDATNSIMECAEEILAADPTDEDYRSLVNERVMRIFEACSFQDITGQRVAKVVETLQTIEARVSRFVEAVNAKDGASLHALAETGPDAERRRRMVSGPPLAGEGNDQSSVDALMGGGAA